MRVPRYYVVTSPPNLDRGQAVTAYVVLRPEATSNGEDLRSFCKERLAPFKVPKTVHLVDGLPKDIQGKTLKRELRQNG